MKPKPLSATARSGVAALCVLFGTALVGSAANITQTWDVGTTVTDSASPVVRSTCVTTNAAGHVTTESVFLFSANGTFSATVPINVTVKYYYPGNDDPDDVDRVDDVYNGGAEGASNVSAGKTITIDLGYDEEEWGSVRVYCAANENEERQPLAFLENTTATRNASNQIKISGTLYSGSGCVMAIVDGNNTNYVNNGATITGREGGTPVSCVPYLPDSNSFHTWKLVAVNDAGEVAVATGKAPFFNGMISIEATSDADEGSLTPGIFTISRPDVASAKTQPLEVAYTIGGTAVGGIPGTGADYVRLSGKVVIPAGQASAQVVVSPLFNTARDEDTTVTLTLDEGPYLWNLAKTTASITITNGEELVLSDIYVDSQSEIGNGTPERPFHSIREGCALAHTNSTVWVRGGADRSYEIEDQTDVVLIAFDNISVRAWASADSNAMVPAIGDEPKGYEDSEHMALIEIHDDFAKKSIGADNPLIRVAATNVLLRGLRFRFKSSAFFFNEYVSGQGWVTRYSHYLITADTESFTIDTCEFLQLDDSSSMPGLIYGGHFGTTIRDCWFHADGFHRITKGLVCIPYDFGNAIHYSIVGSRFERTAGFSGKCHEGGPITFSFVSNRVVNCSNGASGFFCALGNYTPRGGEFAYNIFYRDDFTDGKVYYAISHGGGFGGSFGGDVIIHHNTVIGYDGFLVSKRYNRMESSDWGADTWLPKVFDNLVLSSPNGAFVVEDITGANLMKWRDGKGRVNPSGYLPGTIFRDNAYKGELSGGEAPVQLPGYDLLSCLDMTNNVVFQNEPRFLTNVIEGLDGFRFLEGAYPWCTNGWAGENGEYPPYYGALEPMTSEIFAEEPYPPFLSEIDVVKNADGSFTLLGDLAAGSAKLKALVNEIEIPLTEGGDVDAVFEFEKTVSMVDPNPALRLETNTCYAVTVNATNRFGKADSRSWYAAFLTGEVTIEPAGDARESELKPGRFRIRRPNGYSSCQHDLTVFYEVTGGTAQAGIDYEPLTGSIVIPTGVDSVDLSIQPILNPALTVNTTIEVTLLDYYYYLTDEGKTAMIQIRDNTPAVGDIYVDSLAGNGEEDPDEYEANGSLEKPYRELSVALSTAKTSGDVVHVNCGEGRSYPIEDENDLCTVITSNLTIRTYTIANGKVVHDPGMALVEISENLGASVDAPSIVTVPKGCDNVVISSLDFRYACKNAQTGSGNSLGKGGHVIDISSEYCCVSNCAFRQSGIGTGSWGGYRPLFTNVQQGMQDLGYGLKVLDCRFENIRGGNNQYVIQAPSNVRMCGNVFTNCQYCFYPVRSGWSITFVSNRLVDCGMIGTGTDYGAAGDVEIGYNIFTTKTGEPFLLKEFWGLFDAKIHHNTIVGNGPFIKIQEPSGDYQGGIYWPAWQPSIYNNLLVLEDGTTAIVEAPRNVSDSRFRWDCRDHDFLVNGGYVWEWGVDKFSSFVANAYYATNSLQSTAILYGGTVGETKTDWDIAKGLSIFDNEEYELDEPPHFMSTDPESPDFCRYIGAEYPQFVICERKYPQVRARFYHVTDWIGAQRPHLPSEGTLFLFK